MKGCAFGMLAGAVNKHDNIAVLYAVLAAMVVIWRHIYGKNNCLHRCSWL